MANTQTQKAGCLFCKIVAGEIPSQKIYEDQNVLGFKDIHPAAPFHALFIPKKHFDSLASMEAKDLSVIQDLFGAILKSTHENGLSSDGFRTVINTGEKGGQTVFHLHVHVLGKKTMSANMV